MLSLLHDVIYLISSFTRRVNRCKKYFLNGFLVKYLLSLELICLFTYIIIDIGPSSATDNQISYEAGGDKLNPAQSQKYS